MIALAIVAPTGMPLPANAEVSKVESTPDPAARISRSEFSLPGYPSPYVPECPRVSDDAFEGAVLVGASTAEPFDLMENAPPLTTLSLVGLSPRTALQNKYFSLNGRKMSLLDMLAVSKPTAIYLWLGTNGLDYRAAEEVIVDYELLLDRIITNWPNARIYLMELTPVKANLAERKPLFTNKSVLDYNARLLELAKKYNVYYLPIHALLCNQDGQLSDEYGTGDGLHLRTTAYRLLFDYLYTHMIPTTNPDQGGK